MERNERWLSIGLRLGLLLVFFWIVKPLLIPVALGALFALLLDPLKRKLANRSLRLGRQAPLILTAGSVILVVIPMGVIATSVVSSVQGFLSGGLNEILEGLQGFATTHFAGVADRLNLPPSSLRTGAANLAQRVAGAIAGVASSLPGQVIELFLFVLALYYFLRDGTSLLRWLLRLSPFPEHDTDELFASIRETVHGAIFGQLVTSLVQGGLTMIVLYAFKIPGALMFGILAMLLSILPLVGTTPVTGGAVVYLIASGRFGAAAGMAVAAVLIGLSDNVVRPWVQSSQTRMHPLVTLLSIFGGVEAMGAAGVFLGPVVAAMAIWTIEIYAGIHAKHSPKSMRGLPSV